MANWLKANHGTQGHVHKDDPRGLDKPGGGSKIPPISGDLSQARSGGGTQPGFMTPIPPSPVPEKRHMEACKHPRVQIVAREEDAEFVECLECGDIFEASEFKDMNIEETKPGDEA